MQIPFQSDNGLMVWIVRYFLLHINVEIKQDKGSWWWCDIHTHWSHSNLLLVLQLFPQTREKQLHISLKQASTELRNTLPTNLYAHFFLDEVEFKTTFRCTILLWSEMSDVVAAAAAGCCWLEQAFRCWLVAWISRNESLCWLNVK